MKTYHESCEMILKKIEILKKRRRKRRIITASCIAGLLLIFALILFWPHRFVEKDTVIYATDPRYTLIQKLNYGSGRGKLYKNNYEKWTDGFFNQIKYAPLKPYEYDEYDPHEAQYVQIMSSQKEGVMTGDLVQYSDEYIFSINSGVLYVHTIDGEDSQCVGIYPLSLQEEQMHTAWNMDETVMFLTEDADAVVLVGSAQYEWKENVCQDYVFVQKLDVTDPANITLEKTFYISGSVDSIAQSARLIAGKLFLTSEFKVRNDWDVSKEETYLPQMGSFDQLQCMDVTDIYMSDYALKTHYSVVTMLDVQTLQLLDSAALLSGSEDIYISSEHVYMRCSYARAETGVSVGAVTDIVALRHCDGSLDHQGDISVSGDLIKGTSLHEHNGMLFAFAETEEIKLEYGEFYGVAGRYKNDGNHLYCFSTSNWKLTGAVERFIPIGEEIQCIRYEADRICVCTKNYKIQFKMYVIDLADVDNIICERAGIMDDYPTSVVDFADGYTIGIRIEDQQKVHVQVFDASAVNPALGCSYELGHVLVPTSGSGYMIDPENQMIAIPVHVITGSEDRSAGTQILLIQFEGDDLQAVKSIPLQGNVAYMRTVLIDGYLYMLGDEFKVEKMH